MLRKIVNILVLIPLGLLFVVFAVANRHVVTLSFDPFNSADPSVGVSLPLFVVIIAVAVLGVVAGGIAVWLRQRRWRVAARRHESEAQAARAQIAGLQQQVAVARSSALGASPHLIPGSFGRDKQDAAL